MGCAGSANRGTNEFDPREVPEWPPARPAIPDLPARQPVEPTNSRIPEGLQAGIDGSGHQRRPPSAPKVQNTKTVQSLANLKKNSIKISPDEGFEGQFRIQFVIDSSVPCRAFIYIMAYEKESKKENIPPRLKSKHTMSDPSAEVELFGLDQSYMTPAGEGLPFGLFPEEELTVTNPSQFGQVFPLVIRLMPWDDRVLPGGQASLQAHTTFASLVKHSDGTFGILVLKQLLWVNGTSYVLHEIFGIEKPTLNVSSDDGVDTQGKECVVCLANRRDTLTLPCRHLCLCGDCAKSLRHSTNKCPICRTIVKSLLQIKVAESGPGNENPEPTVSILQD